MSVDFVYYIGGIRKDGKIIPLGPFNADGELRPADINNNDVLPFANLLTGFKAVEKSMISDELGQHLTPPMEKRLYYMYFDEFDVPMNVERIEEAGQEAIEQVERLKHVLTMLYYQFELREKDIVPILLLLIY